MSDSNQLAESGRRLIALARYGFFVGAERIRPFRSTNPRDVPRSAEAMTPAWLSAVLCAKVAGARVTDIQVLNGSDGTTTRREVRVRYNDEGNAAGLPIKLFSKATTELKTRMMLCPIGRIENECKFYTDFRPKLDIEAPTAVYAGYDHASGRSLILMPDLVETVGATFLDPSHYIDRAQAEDMVSLIASYQATFWNSPAITTTSRWLRTTLQYQQGANQSIPFEANSMTGIDRAESVLPPSILRRKSDIWAVHMASIALSARSPQTFTHWDMHIGNWYRTSAGRMGLSDWGIKCGHWGADVTYAIVSALTTADRRAWEQDLLMLYRERLLEYGVKDAPGFAELWLEYRRQTFHPFFFWATTIGAGRMQPNMQPDHISLANLQRMGQAIDDVDAFEAVETA